MRNSLKIAVIDDDSQILSLLEMALTDAGYEVCSYNTTENIIAKLCACNPDIIISDIDITPINGVDLLHIVKHNDFLSAVPFVFMTGKSRPTRLVDAMRAGVDGYMEKPIEISELIEKIDASVKKEDKNRHVNLLIVDRSLVVRKQTQKVFSDHVFEVVTAASISEANEKIEAQIPDIIISSVKFDQQDDGYNFCKTFKSTHPDKLFVFLTAATTTDEVMAGIQAGADDYIEKSIQPIALKMKIKALSNRKFKSGSLPQTNATGTIQTTLTDHSFVELLKSCEEQNFTGTMSINNGNEKAAIEFENGLPKSMYMDGKSEDVIMDLLLSWESGNVTIEQKTLKI